MARKFLNGNAETGPLTVTQPVTTTGAPVIETLTGAANTGLTAATEVNDVYWNLSRTVTWATTVPTTQRAVYINASSLVYAAGSTTQTITTAATLAINGAPGNGTNITITTPLAFWVESGNALFAGKVTSTGAAVLDTGANGSSFGGSLEVTTTLGVGTAAVTNGGIIYGGTPTSSGSATGIQSEPTFSNGTTGSGNTIIASPSTQAASFTMTSLYGFKYANVSIGSGSTVTTQFAFYTAALSGAGTSYAFYSAGAGLVSFGDTTAVSGVTAAVTTAGGLYVSLGIKNAGAAVLDTGANGSSFGGTLQIASYVGVGQAPITSQGLTVATTTTGASTQESITTIGVFDSTCTVESRAFYSHFSTAAASFTLALAKGFYYANPTIGAGSAITTQAAVYIAALSGATTNYAFYSAGAGLVQISDVTSASTSLLGAVVIGNGTAATSIGMGAGNINVGGTGAFGGAVTLSSTVSQTYSTAATTSTNANAQSVTSTGAVSSANIVGEYVILTVNPGSATTSAQYFGSQTIVTTANLANTNLAGASLYGSYANATFNTANTSGAAVLANLFGLQAVISVVASNTSGSNTVSNVYGLDVAPSTFSTAAGGTTTITNYYGLYLGTVTTSGSGTTTITNRYGLYQQDAAATNSFAGPIASTNTFAQTYSSSATTTTIASASTVTYTGAVTGTMVGDSSSVTATPGGSATGTWVALQGIASVSSATNVNAAGGTLVAVSAQASFATANTSGATVLAALVACQVVPSVGSSNATATNTITNVYGVEVAPGTWTASGGGGLTVTNYYGLYLGTVTLSTTTITNKYGIYQADGNATNSLSGTIVQNWTTTATAASNFPALSVTATANPGSLTSGGNQVIGVYALVQASTTGTNSSNSGLIGAYVNPTFTTSNTSGASVLINLIGVEVLLNVNGTNATGTNTLSNVYGFYCNPNSSGGGWAVSGGGGMTVTNYYGLYLGLLSLSAVTITNRYGIYQFDSLSTNIFNGSAHTFGLTTATAGAISHLGTGGIKTIAAATQDGMQIVGRSGGSSSFFTTITPGVLTASITLTSPLASGTLTTGSGSSSQIATWNGTNSLTGASTFTATTTSGALIVALASGTSTATTATNINSTTATFTGAVSSAVVSGVYSAPVGTPGSASTGSYVGFYSIPSISSAANVFGAGAGIYGAYLNPTFSTSNTSGAAVLSVLAGAWINLAISSSNATTTNTIANVYGLWVNSGTWTASGGGGLAITNYYGLYLATQALTTATITNRYGVYQQDAAATNVFAGMMTVANSSFANTTAANLVSITPTFTGAAGSVNLITLFVNPTINPTAASTASYIGIMVNPTVTSTTTNFLTGASQYGIYCNPIFNSAYNTIATVLTSMFGIVSIPTMTTTGATSNQTITNVYCLYATSSITGPAGETLFITNHYGLYLPNPSVSDGQITNRYGIYQQDISAQNYFGGNVLHAGGIADANISSSSWSTGGSVTVANLIYTVLNTNSATISTFTVTLPSTSTSNTGQMVRIVSNGIVTTLTVAAGGGTTLGTNGNPNGTLAAGASIEYVRSGTVWYRVR